MKITVRHYTFDCCDIFSDGDVIDDDAARLLNRVRANALRDIWTKRTPSGVLLTPSDLAASRTRFIEFAAAYGLPELASPRLVWTLDDEINELLARGYRQADAEDAARLRYAARFNLDLPLSSADIL